MQALQENSQSKDYLYLGYPLHLTPTELVILRALSEKGCCPITALGVGSAATVSVHVCSINKKAKTIGGRPLIRMIRGSGYQLCDDI